jgi:NAD(P)H-hydrate epimerase
MPATPLYTADHVRAIEARALALLDLPPLALMRRAAAAALAALRARWPDARRVLVVCGPGHNGGDGYALAVLARAAGLRVEVVALPAHAPRAADPQAMLAEWTAGGGAVREFDGSLPAADVVVDAVFGLGPLRVPEGEVAALLAAINAQPAPVFALDLPSGIDADHGHAPGVAVRAAMTLVFVAPKRGLATGAGLACAGEQRFDPLGVPDAAADGIAPAAWRLAPTALREAFAPRPRGMHKGAAGQVLCLGGDAGYGGAVRLCAEAALRVGAGLVGVGTRAAHVGALLAARPEAMALGLETEDAEALAEALGPRLASADVIAIGPGLGRGGWGAALLALARAADRPLVLDADALNLLALEASGEGGLLAPLPAGSVITPHPGEAARLLGCSVAEVEADRYGAVAALAANLGAVAVLKGAGTLVAAPGEAARVIAAGNPGMASGGMGDLLTGAIAGLLAQALASDPAQARAPLHAAVRAAEAGALLHAMAGDSAAAEGGERGLLATDLLPWLRRHANPPGGEAGACA